ncbi:Dual specificity phosphatase [Aphelenchoides bicaudatus]|nr:Dual specificity phosphatase [Aphelenchoides bicaudatus]
MTENHSFESSQSGSFNPLQNDNRRYDRSGHDGNSAQNNRNYQNHGGHDGDSGQNNRNYQNRGGRKPFMPWRQPDRWSDYSFLGKVIPEARIISFKTPLKARYFAKDTPQFGITELLDEVKLLGGELGLVVDLTYTTKYYEPTDLTDRGVEYKKIFCPGRDFGGLEKLGAEFIGIVKEYLERNGNNQKWVGVHCTHGLNRTGYLVCRYLHEALGWPMDEAIEKFETARGHEIEREEYLLELRKLNLNAE